jgi:hypothetical protein
VIRNKIVYPLDDAIVEVTKISGELTPEEEADITKKLDALRDRKRGYIVLSKNFECEFKDRKEEADGDE